MRVNAQCRNCFIWKSGDAYDVELVDYHYRKAMPDFPHAHPGDVLRDDYLSPLGVSQYALARALGVLQLRISEICRDKRAITADTALRLARYFGVTPEFRLGMQAAYDIAVACETKGAVIDAVVRPRAA